MVTSLTDENENIIDNQLTAYQYDQLNRIKQVRAHRNFNTSTNAFAGSSGDDGTYQEDFVYDRNGNILEVGRNGNNAVGSGMQVMDAFSYRYYDNTGSSFTYSGGMPLNATNKLAYVYDGAVSGNYTTDIDNQATDNYEYDGNGNLISDASEEIEKIEWYANGKIKSIKRISTSTKSDLEFVYDAQGNRIVKITKPRDGTNIDPLSQLHWTYTYYTRDASGNVMSVYERTFESAGGDDYHDKFNCAELHIYGTKRVGTDNVDSLITYTFEDGVFADGYNEMFDPSYDAVGAGTPCTNHCKSNYRRELGNKQYEVTNHLGNVLATVSDRKLSVDDYSYTSWSSGTKYAYDAQRNIYYQNASGTYQRTPASSDSKADWYTADVISYSDYYAFGAQMDGRNANDYRYSYESQEKDEEVWGGAISFKYRIEDARLGRFMSVDPLANDYAYNSPYAFAENKLGLGVELEGAELHYFGPINGLQASRGMAALAESTADGIVHATTRFGAGLINGATWGYGDMTSGVPERTCTFWGYYRFNFNQGFVYHAYSRDESPSNSGDVSFEDGIGILSGTFSIITFGMPTASAAGATQSAWRTMSYADYFSLRLTGELPASWSGETFIATSPQYAQKYLGRSRYDVLVEFTLEPGTYQNLASMGVKDGSSMTRGFDMPNVSKGWTRTGVAYFKSEKGYLNIGLGTSNALETFNNGMIGYKPVQFAPKPPVKVGVGVGAKAK